MPAYRVVGTVHVPFIHEVDAESMEAAESLVENIRLDGLDNYDTTTADNIISYSIELDDDGNEVE